MAKKLLSETIDFCLRRCAVPKIHRHVFEGESRDLCRLRSLAKRDELWGVLGSLYLSVPLAFVPLPLLFLTPSPLIIIPSPLSLPTKAPSPLFPYQSFPFGVYLAFESPPSAFSILPSPSPLPLHLYPLPPFPLLLNYLTN